MLTGMAFGLSVPEPRSSPWKKPLLSNGPPAIFRRGVADAQTSFLVGNSAVLYLAGWLRGAPRARKARRSSAAVSHCAERPGHGERPGDGTERALFAQRFSTIAH